MIKIIKFIFILTFFTAGIMALINEKYIIFVKAFWILYSIYVINEELQQKKRSIPMIILFSIVLILSILVFIKSVL